jgi:hypothetical protein
MKMNYGYDERVNEQVIDGDYPRDGADRRSFCGMLWCWGLVPFVVKHEDIRLVLIKD